jgi:hypothetical protein
MLILAKPPTVATYTFWLNSESAASSATGSPGINLALEFYVLAACNAIGVRYYRDANMTASRVGALYNSPAGTGSLIESVNFIGDTAIGWQAVNFASPIPLTANTHYLSRIYSSDAFYNYGDSFFTSPVTRGNIVGVTQWYDIGGGPPKNPANASQFAYYTDIIID